LNKVKDIHLTWISFILDLIFKNNESRIKRKSEQKRGSYSMMKIPVEKLGLFEQLDRIVVAFFSKQQPSSPYDLNISITQEHLDQKKQELEPLGYQAVQLPLGMALDNIIQQPHYQNLIIGGLAPDEIIVSKEELMPMKDKTVYFIGKLFTDIPKAGDEIAYLGIDRMAGDGTPYEAVKCFLTEESAEKFNDEKRPVTPANLAYLKSFWGKPVIIEPYRNYWIEFL